MSLRHSVAVLLVCMFILPSIASAVELETTYPTTLYGYVRMEAFYDNTEVAKGDWLLFARPDGSAQSEQSVFSMNARHTRLGLKMEGPELRPGVQLKTLVEIDFAGGFPNSGTAARQPLLRLRHAWLEVSGEKWQGRFGQDWALISGPFPNTTSFVVGAGKGNLWMRYPQIKLTRIAGPLKLSASLNRPMAGNVKYDDFAGGDFDPVLDGEKSGLPWVMGRAWLTGGPAVVSISGHYGQEQINDLSGTDHDMSTYSINGDVVLQLGPAQFTARAFYGENLNSFFGGVFQGFQRDSTEVTNIPAMGGWAQVKMALNDHWALTLGGGMDDPDDDELTSGQRAKNDWFFGNIAYAPVKPLLFMLETSYLKTSYVDLDAGTNMRVQFMTRYLF